MYRQISNNNLGKISQAQFIRIDHDYAVEAARLFHAENTDSAKNGDDSNQLHCLLVTAVGTNPRSLFLYPQTKGRIECAYQQLGFARLSVFRPGMLLGRRDVRVAEQACSVCICIYL